MGRIHLNLLGNAFHSFMLPELWSLFDQQQGCIPAIGQSKIPVSMSFQTLDFEFWPWLREVLKSHPSIELTNGMYSHALTPLMSTKHQRWQVEHSANPDHPICFYPEFYSPESQFISDAFLVLASQTVAYSVTDSLDLDQPYADQGIAQHDAIAYGGKTGLVMKGFEPIIKLFFDWQRDPGNEILLAHLMRAIEKSASSTDGVIIMPLDIEAPYVGSLEPDFIWPAFFQAINDFGMADLFITLGETLDRLKPLAKKSRRPHRQTGTKWTKYEIQWRYQAKLMAIEPKSEREHIILAIAGCSDLLSALGRKIEAPRRIPKLSAKDKDGQEAEIILGYSQPVLDICFTATHSLADSNSFAEEMALKGEPDKLSLLEQRIISWALTNNL